MSSEVDWCTEEGARRLKQRIVDYWKGEGYHVQVELVSASFVATMRSRRTDLRSNMVNGFPRREVDS